MKEIIIGYDLRKESLESEWTQARRDAFLIKPHIKPPFSVDTNVSSSYFSFQRTFSSQSNTYIEPQDSHQQSLGLWRSQADMMRLSRKQIDASKLSTYLPIAITAVEDDRWWKYLVEKHISTINPEHELQHPLKTGYIKNLHKMWSSLLEEPVDPSQVDSNWTLMGYDIADGFFLSGLLNCGFDVNERNKIKEKWGQKINNFGLFDNAESALVFRDETNLRVKEHAPFFVFGIYRTPILG